MFYRPDEPKIVFLCRPQDAGVIPVPVPAKNYLPDWFRRLKPVTEDAVTPTSSGLTVKRCMPFLDAMTTGWIIPLAATVRLEISDSGRTVNSGWDFDREMVSGHGAHQIRGHPRGHLPPCKFHNYWTIRTPPGWSCLFVDPLNRPNGVFELIAGIVDTDTYVSEIHFPFLATGAEGIHIIEQGSPLVQVIPFRREDTLIGEEIRAETPNEGADRERILRNTQASPGWYRDHARERRA
ncbi:DUF6065 family protein [Hoeflea sp.]|uniref:DUF6065 family protein n=1 Tax=Hoeflea sp. TaxID=1940281 RepID=UPI003B014B40